MFIGHIAVAFAAKKAAPKASLGTYFIAAQLVDMMWPLLLLLGVEHVRIDPGNTLMTPMDFYDYPITHSLLGGLGWAVLAGGLYYSVRKDKRTSLVIAAVVLSHWVLDVASHRPDMPLWFGDSPKLGLGLWNSMVGTLIVEIGLFAAGIWAYVSVTEPKNRTGSMALWVLIGFLSVAYLANSFGPPPPSVEMVAYSGLSFWLLSLWPYWIDRNRGIKHQTSNTKS